MSANILRELVSKVFQVKSKNVILSGEMKSDSEFGGNTCWSSQTTQQYYKVWGFCPTKGFVRLEGLVSNYNNNESGEGYITEGCKLYEVKNVEDYIFFLVEDKVVAKDHNYCSHTWTLYKAPSFKEKMAQIEAGDLARWEQWLTNEAV